jgi:uncharacterized membrane protein YfbV (UPF0208 family)
MANRTRLAFVVLTAVVTVLVLVQAALAGQFLFGTGDIEVHGYVGNASFALGVVAVVIAFAGRLSGLVVALSTALVALLFAQTGLGYVGRESTTAASWHIPLGVTAFGVSAAALTAGVLLGRR